MNNYIIDPSVFYWINVLAIIQTVTAVVGAILLLCAIGFTIAYFLRITYVEKEPVKPKAPSEEELKDMNENHQAYVKHQYEHDMYVYEGDLNRRKKQLQELHTYRKWAIICAIPGLIFVLASIFIPGKTTSVEMVVAKTATFDNVNWTVQQVKEIIDYIVVSLKGVV